MIRYLLALAVLTTALNAGPAPTPEGCARNLGISYSIEDGATERLDAFAACLAR